MGPNRNERSSRRSHLRFALTASPVGFGQSAFAALTPVMIAASGLGTASFGFAAMLGAASFIIAAPIWSARGDAARTFALFASLMIASHAILIFLLFAPNASWLAAIALLTMSRLIYGAATAGLTPAIQSAAIRATSQDERPGALARIGAGLAAGRIAGSLIGLAAPIAAAAPFIALLVSPLIILLAPPREMRAASQSAETPATAGNRWRIAPFLTIGLGTALCAGMMQITIGVFIQARFLPDPADATFAAGWIYALVGAAMIVTQISAARLPWRAKPAVLLGLALVAIGALLVSVAGVLSLIAAGVVIAGVGVALAAPFYASWSIAGVAENEQRAALGWLSSAQVLGQGVGAAVGGALFERWPQSPWLACAAIAAALAILVALTDERGAR